MRRDCRWVAVLGTCHHLRGARRSACCAAAYRAGWSAAMMTTERTQRRLELIVDSVTESYRLGRPIDNLESTALPNQRRIVEAMSDLQHVTYMGFYSVQLLSPVNLRQRIGEHVYRAAEAL